MADYYRFYTNVFLNEYNLKNDVFQPNQLIKFRYAQSEGIKVGIVLREWPVNEKLHILKLNTIHPIYFKNNIKRLLDFSMIANYEKAISYGVFEQLYVSNNYKLPLLNSTNSEVFYTQFVKPHPVLASKEVYRTYNIRFILDVKLIVPDLQKLKLASNNILKEDVSDTEKFEFLNEMRGR